MTFGFVILLIDRYVMEADGLEKEIYAYCLVIACILSGIAMLGILVRHIKKVIVRYDLYEWRIVSQTFDHVSERQTNIVTPLNNCLDESSN